MIFGSPDIAAKMGSDFTPVRALDICGVARNLKAGGPPLNGLRHPPTETSSGWFIWAGPELGQAHDYFQPLCAEHLREECPAVLPYLGLAPGWRFLVAPGHEDVWFDANLLNV